MGDCRESMRHPTLHELREANADKKLFCALLMVYKVRIVCGCECDHTVYCKHYANCGSNVMYH